MNFTLYTAIELNEIWCLERLSVLKKGVNASVDFTEQSHSIPEPLVMAQRVGVRKVMRELPIRHDPYARPW